MLSIGQNAGAESFNEPELKAMKKVCQKMILPVNFFVKWHYYMCNLEEGTSFNCFASLFAWNCCSSGMYESKSNTSKISKWHSGFVPVSCYFRGSLTHGLNIFSFINCLDRKIVIGMVQSLACCL